MTETAMPKLPIHPVFLLLAYALAMFADLAIAGREKAELWAEVLSLLPVILHLWWTVSATKFSTQISQGSTNLGKVKWCLTASFVILIFVISHDHWWGASIPENIEYTLAIGLNALGAGAAITIFASFWFAATAVCEAEKKPGSVVLTFLEFVYLPFGAFFIFPRLKRAWTEASERNLLQY